MHFCDGKTEFSAAITHVFSVTYSLNKIITCKKNVYIYWVSIYYLIIVYYIYIIFIYHLIIY